MTTLATGLRARRTGRYWKASRMAYRLANNGQPLAAMIWAMRAAKWLDSVKPRSMARIGGTAA
jgi:hypothetical protein